MKKTNKELWGKKQVFILTAIPYDQDIVVAINADMHDVRKFLKDLKELAADKNVEYIDKELKDYMKLEGNTQGRMFSHFPFGFAVLLKHKESWVETAGLVSHECLHLTHYILKRAGLTLSEESEEAYTYLQEYLLKEILKKMY